MGLTRKSVGSGIFDNTTIKKSNEYVIALAGNPNVGKSTIFNALTGLNQHTGNWPGKTISGAEGRYSDEFGDKILVDIPGTYSLLAHSAEEEIARNFICFGNTDATIVVCDATCLERNLNLVLQTLEISKNTVVCVNLLDEARRKHINVDLGRLSQSLGVPVVGISARKKHEADKIMQVLNNNILNPKESSPFIVHYEEEIESAIVELEPLVKELVGERINSRWLTLRLLMPDSSLLSECEKYLGFNILADEEFASALEKVLKGLKDRGLDREGIEDSVTASIYAAAERIAGSAVSFTKENPNYADRKIDKILTGKLIGYPIMLLFAGLIFWITIVGANYPSELLSNLFSVFENKINQILLFLNSPEWLRSILVDGMFRVLFWVVAVMLPPMAIFFPLFTLLEDVGYLPRIAYNLDNPFRKCKACGKQALTMCMGFGCNAAGIVGCRIIDSPRERMLAILTNNFVPCNGRLPQQKFGKNQLFLLWRCG